MQTNASVRCTPVDPDKVPHQIYEPIIRRFTARQIFFCKAYWTSSSFCSASRSVTR